MNSCVRVALAFGLAACGATPVWPQATLAPLTAQVVGAPGKAGVGPAIDRIEFSGNKKLGAAELAALIQLSVGTPLSTSAVQPELDRITARYATLGGAYVQPSIVEVALNHVKVIFQIHEGVVAMEYPDAAPAPKFFDAYLGNTLVCAAAQTANDLCHMWLEKDGTFLIFDPNGAHTGTWKASRLRWDISEFVMPAELQTSPMAPAPVAPPAVVASAAALAATVPPPTATTPPPRAQGARICETKNFRTKCTAYPDVSILSAELQRKAKRSRDQMNHEEGSCYSHGPHALNEAWFEWDNHSPGQLGLDREILVPGHQ